MQTVAVEPPIVHLDRDDAVNRRRRQIPMRSLIVGALVILTIVVISISAWAGNPVNFESVTVSLITALSLGSIYAMSASGIVVTYTSTGVFNFAQGAIGMFLSFVFWEFAVDLGLPNVVALILVVLVFAPLFGILLDRVLMRMLVGTSLVVQLVATLGLMLGLMGLAQMIWDPTVARSTTFFFGSNGFHVGHTLVLWDRALTIVIAAAIAIGLRVVLHGTRMGVTMRAVVDSRPLAALHGARPNRVSMMAWALSTSMAALAGILLAPEVGVAVLPLTLITISAFAAAIIGRMKSLPMTFIGAMGLGLVTTYATNFLNLAGRWTNFIAAIPALFLLAALLFIPQAATQVGRVRTSLRQGRQRTPTVKEAILGMVVLLVVVTAVSQGMGQVNLNRLALAMATAFVLLSFIPLTGWAGQVSLAQITFAGIGAFTMWKVAGTSGDLWGLVAAAVVTMPFGCLMALPALRLQGLYLALASLAFALIGENLLFPQPEIFGDAGRPLTRPNFLGINLANERSFLIFLSVLFALAGIGLVFIRRGSFGRRLIALRESEAACVTAGINPIVTKLVVFGASASIAGVGGALLALQRQSASASDFTMLGGIPLVLLVVVGGVELVGGALFGGILLVLFTIIESIWNVSFLTSLELLGPGLLALGVSRNPQGSVAEIGRALSPLLPWRRRESAVLRERLATMEAGDVPGVSAAESNSMPALVGEPVDDAH